MTKTTKSYKILTTTVQDTEPPIIIIKRPTPGEVVILSSTQPLIVSGDAADVGSGLDYIEVSLNGGTFAKAAGTTNWAANINNVLSGNHTARARARDKAGNLSAERSVFFSVTRTVVLPPPPPPVVPPPPPSTGGGTTWITWPEPSYRVNINPTSNAADVIQAAVSDIRSRGAGILHINPGIYNLTKNVSFSGINNFILEGNSKESTILRSNASNDVNGIGVVNMFTKSGSSLTTNFTIRNINIDGGNVSKKLLDFGNIKNMLLDNIILERHNAGGTYSKEEGPGVYIERLNGGLVQNSIIRNPSGIGDAFAIGGYRLTFRLNDVTRTSTPGGGFTSGGLVDSRIHNNDFHDLNGYSATSLENFNSRANDTAGGTSGKYSFKNVEIDHNNYRNIHGGNAISSLGFAASNDGSPPEAREFYNINVHHNNISDTDGGIIMNASDTWPNRVTYSSNISNNTLLRTSGIAAGPLNNCTINDNTVNTTNGKWRSYGVYLYPGCDYVTMSGNKISNTTKPAYYYVGSTHITVIP